jgi:four helix bundle protein
LEGNLNQDDLRKRTKDFAVRVIRLASRLPAGRIGDILGRQIVKSGTSIGANYRESLRASSKRHFITIIEIAAREADETLYWLELLSEAGIIKRVRLGDLIQECNEFLAILIATARTAKRRLSTNPKS